MKIYTLGEGGKIKWICDILKYEFEEYNADIITNNINEADIIWILCSWRIKEISPIILNKKCVVTTIHHIDWNKYKKDEYLDKYTTYYHAICPKVEQDIRKITTKPIITSNFWINENVFFNMTNKKSLKDKYKIPHDKFIVGSFQRDTEGSDPNMPKLSKGPDIFIKIINNMKDQDKNPFVVLSGWRRTYVINELKKNNIPYIYYELIQPDQLNELYNCLDLYVVSSRCEGGPRSIMECGQTLTPIISTDVGISNIILDNSSIFDMNNYLSYVDAIPNIHIAKMNTDKYKISNFMKEFVNKLFVNEK